jgi:hypothetical protein
MKMSPRKFRDELTDRMLNIHWKQWTAFGVSSHWNRTSDHILDLEALTVSTIAIGLWDKRLSHVAMEWLQKNRQWLNLHRVKRIGKLFVGSETYKQNPLLDSAVMEVYLDFLKPSPSSLAHHSEHQNYQSDVVYEHINLVSGYKPRGTVVGPDIRSTCLLQLFLRSVFGIDARAEMLLYFLCGRRGNSNFISSEIYFEQKNLLRILKNWADAGVIEEDLEASSPDYGLKNRSFWIQALGIEHPSPYINWTRIFLFLVRLAKGLEDSHLQNDRYLVSSFFRDLTPEVQYAASITRVDLPHEKSLHGEAYFEPFAECVLQILEKLSS